MEGLAENMEKGGYPRESANSLIAFANDCVGTDQMMERAYWALIRLADYDGARSIAAKLITFDPASYNYRYWHGFAFEKEKNYKNALADYISTLNLFTDLSNVHVNEFYRVSRMYDATGHPCEAITPLETFISYEPTKRRTQQLSTLIKNYATKGKCWSTYASGADRLLLQPGNIIEVTIDGAAGRFILDTGATLIAVTPEFAARAGIAFDPQNLITVKTAGGTMQTALTNANRVRIGNTEANDVALTVAVGTKDAYGRNRDGLLGMSFLARFNVSIADGYVEFRPRSLTQLN
jgi:aspartyl protease family protein